MPLFLLLAAAAGLFMLSSKKQPVPSAQLPQLPQLPAATTSPGIVPTSKPVAPLPVIPDTIVKAINTAMASLDPEVINTLASQLDKQGYNQQAADLRAFSKGMMSAMNKA